MFDSLKKALGRTEDDPSAVLAELKKTEAELNALRDKLHQKRRDRWEALFPGGPVSGCELVTEGSAGRFPELDPVNFEETEPQNLLISAATGIIDNFPGSATLLSQLDKTLEAFADANYYRVDAQDTAYSYLVEWQNDILRCWDMHQRVPVYVAPGGGTQILGCNKPLVVLDRGALDPLEEESKQFMLATALAHIFFGNLKIFAFHRLMGMFDKLPSMTGFIARGLGMIPGVGNTISRGLEIARSLNDQIIRKTNLVVGQRQHVLCDRLAVLSHGSFQPAYRYLAERAMGGSACEEDSVHRALIAQGRQVHERFERGEIDLTMLSIVSPNADFAAYRAYKLKMWEEDERSKKLALGYYITTSGLKAYRASNRTLEEDLQRLETRILDVFKRETALREALGRVQK